MLQTKITKIERISVTDEPVYNLGVFDDESYTVNGYAVHNCSDP